MKFKALLGLVVAVALAAPAAASAAQWDQTLALYGWGTWITGNSNFGPKESEVKVSAGDVIGALEMGAMARYRAQTDRWAVVFDGIYASLGGTKDGTPKLELDLNQYIFQLDGAYRFSEHSEALFGVRYVRFESTLDVGRGGPLSRSLSGDASFWDPVVGLRTIRPLSGKWLLQAQGDLGGGANMDFTWQAMVNLGYQASAKTSLWLGYRALGMKFDHSGNNNRFGMDTTTHGPEAGLALHF